MPEKPQTGLTVNTIVTVPSAVEDSKSGDWGGRGRGVLLTSRTGESVYPDKSQFCVWEKPSVSKELKGGSKLPP